MIMNVRKNILITGASGFIGGHVVKYFVKKNLNVFCLVRNASNVDFIRELPVQYVKGDITEYPGLSKAVRGMDTIIHIAAITSDWGKWENFCRVNVEGTLNVLKAAKEHSIDQVIITGSVSSYGEEDSEMIKDEYSPDNAHYSYFLDRVFPSGMNYYRDSKCLATRNAIEFASKNDINLTILEPVWVYGENEFSSGFFEYLRAVKSGMLVMPGSKKNNFHVVYAGDLAEAYYHAFKQKLLGTNRIIIGNETTEKMQRIYNLFCWEAGLKNPIRLPRRLLYPLAFIMELTAHILRYEKAPQLTRARVNMFYDNIEYNTAKSMRMLSFKAVTPLEDGIARTVDWYKQHKYL